MRTRCAPSCGRFPEVSIAEAATSQRDHQPALPCRTPRSRSEGKPPSRPCMPVPAGAGLIVGLFCRDEPVRLSERSQRDSHARIRIAHSPRDGDNLDRQRRPGRHPWRWARCRSGLSDRRAAGNRQDHLGASVSVGRRPPRGALSLRYSVRERARAASRRRPPRLDIGRDRRVRADAARSKPRPRPGADAFPPCRNGA